MRASFVCSMLVLGQSLMAADITGKWVAEIRRPDGETMRTVFALQNDGERVTGFLSSFFGDQAISEGTLANGNLRFTVTMEMFGVERKVEYTGVLKGEDEMEVTMPRMGPPPGSGAGPRMPNSLLAKRVSREMPEMAKLPPPVLPELVDLRANGLARTPPMGWNSWNKFQRNVDQKTVREIADAVVSSGMKDAGYVYINIDDGWQGKRDAAGALQPNAKFPDMKGLADYIHSKGLKIGIYSSPGPLTCARFEGSYGHEEQDAKQWAAWGIDYLKYDWCSGSRVYKQTEMRAAYQKMAQAIAATKRPMVYALCQYGVNRVGEWGPKVAGNLWRTGVDIRDSWQSMEEIGFEKQEGWEAYAGPGSWNDPDMLEVGNGRMTAAEYRTHMSLWAMLAAPLLAGNDVRAMDADTKAILLNREVIAVDQDPLGRQGRRISKAGNTEIWMKDLAKGDYAVALFNRGETPADMTMTIEQVGVGEKERARARDLWAGKEVETAIDGVYQATVEPHGVVMLRVRK